MKTNVWGQYYDAVLLQIAKPKTVDISSVDYIAEKLNKIAVTDNLNGTQRPFIVCEDVSVTLKVEHWNGAIEPSWKFTPGPYPMLLRRIFSDAANVFTQNGDPITTIQIGY